MLKPASATPRQNRLNAPGTKYAGLVLLAHRHVDLLRLAKRQRNAQSQARNAQRRRRHILLHARRLDAGRRAGPASARTAEASTPTRDSGLRVEHLQPADGLGQQHFQRAAAQLAADRVAAAGDGENRNAEHDDRLVVANGDAPGVRQAADRSGTGQKSLNWSQTCSMIAANWLVCSRLTMNTRTPAERQTAAAPSAANSRRASTRHFLRRAGSTGAGFRVQGSGEASAARCWRQLRRALARRACCGLFGVKPIDRSSAGRSARSAHRPAAAWRATAAAAPARRAFPRRLR